MAKSECALCRGKRSEFVCAQCASDMLQQRRTMLAALQADVAVLRHKTEASLGGKSRLLEAERQLDERMRRVEALAEKVMKVREQLCSERIALVERTSRLEERARVVAASQQRALAARQQAEGWHLPVLESLDFQVQWAHENAAKGRGEKIRELYALFALTPDDRADDEDEGDDEDDLLGDAKSTPPSMDQGAKRESRPVYFRTISGMPLPISGRYANMPPEVAAAALGQVIHLLQCLVKYLKLTYPHPMVFNGSFSTIGNTSEGAGCHTLYPDGSPGFARAVEMLHENVAFLCATQGVSRQAVHPTDLLANLLHVYRSPRLGTLSDDADVASTCRSASSRATAATSASPENSQALSSSIEILPHYS